MALETTRRGLITGLIAFAAAPAIVRAASLMPVKVMEPEAVAFTEFVPRDGTYFRTDRTIWLFGDHIYVSDETGELIYYRYESPSSDPLFHAHGETPC